MKDGRNPPGSRLGHPSYKSFAWWGVTLAPILAVLTLAATLNFSIARKTSISLHKYKKFEFTYYGTSHGQKSPACGCLNPNPYEWRGMTFVYDRLSLGPLITTDGVRTGYNLSSPFPGGVSFMIPVGLTENVDIYDVHDLLPAQYEDVILRDVGEPELRQKIRLVGIRAVGAITIESSHALTIAAESETAVGAWLPLQGSSLELSQPEKFGEQRSWSILERLGIDRTEKDHPFERVGSAEAVPTELSNWQHPIVDLIGTRFLIPVNEGDILHFSSGDPVQLSPVAGQHLVAAVDVPFSVRIGILGWAHAAEQDLRGFANGRQSDEKLFQAPTPLSGSLPANIVTSEAAENRALASIRHEPVIWVTAADVRAPNVSERIVMVRPPIPRMPGENVFGPVKKMIFHESNGDIVVGADPYAKYSAPVDVTVEPDDVKPFRGPIPISVSPEDMTLDSDYIGMARVSVNGENITPARGLLPGVWKDIVNVGSVLGLIGWIASRWRDALKREVAPMRRQPVSKNRPRR